MRVNKKAMLAAGLLMSATALTGCMGDSKPVATPTPQAAQQTTAQPATAEPKTTAAVETLPATPAENGEGEKAETLPLMVEGKEAKAGAMTEEDRLLLPLIETGELLGWKAGGEEISEETQAKRVVTLEKDESRITVSWTVSDNTIKGITWQKDGLLIPVDTRIVMKDETVYVPAAFFEEAMDASVIREEKGVSVKAGKPRETPETQPQEAGENG